MSFEPTASDALFRLVAHARDEARDQKLPLVEYLLAMALEELGETIQRRGESARDGEEKRI